LTRISGVNKESHRGGAENAAKIAKIAELPKLKNGNWKLVRHALTCIGRREELNDNAASQL
jgi:hypothetical protein